jgi:hypothetical protein
VQRPAATSLCEHFAPLAPVEPRSKRCEACASIGAQWYELRMCATCGNVGCCEDSPHAHALAHHRESGHPVIVPLDRREGWAWCYPHGRYFDGAAERLRVRPRSWVARLIDRFATVRPGG